MIKHIVGWTFSDDGDGKQANVAKVAEALRALVGVVPGIGEFEVVTPQQGLESSFDLMLYSTFEDLDALRGYVVHPAHQVVVGLIRSVVASRVAVDYDPELL